MFRMLVCNIKCILFYFLIIKDTENTEESLAWLHNSCDPWDIVERYWYITTKIRLEKVLTTNSQDVVSSIADYMKDFPALKKPAGYRLVSF